MITGGLSPGGSVSIYNGKQQTFTCSVAGAAVWTITGLRGITATKSTGLSAANNNPRITTTDTSGLTPFSTITITGFNTSDNGGAIQCIELADGSVHGKTNISIGTAMYYFRAAYVISGVVIYDTWLSCVIFT